MNLEEDRKILIGALESARDHQLRGPPRSLLSGPGEAVTDAVSDAINRCSAYNQAAGKMIYSGGSGPVLTASFLATHLLSKAERNDGKDIPQAAEWLLRLLTTKETTGLFKIAVWGAAINRDLRLADGSHIMPFGDLPDSYMKTRILERSRSCYDNSAWLAHNYFDAPTSAFVQEVPSFPYISANGSPFQRIADLEYGARDRWSFIQAASVGHPLALGCWFEYADSELDINGWDNHLAWILPEVHPRVSSCAALEASAVQEQIGRYDALPRELQSRLLRSIERFALSQCRHKLIDRVLDLELAFEIAVSGPGPDNSPMGWKVSVRSAQMMGGTLAARKNNRDLINDLFKLRSAATHGSDLGGRGEKVQETVGRCLIAYKQLIASFLDHGGLPDWSSLELEARQLPSDGRPAIREP
jgi:hypothetical protein